MVGSTFVPKYYGDYFDRPWYEKDFLEYFDYWEYSDMSKNPTKYFEKKKVVNFDIIHHECRGDPLHRSYKDYQTVNNKDLQNIQRMKEKK